MVGRRSSSGSKKPPVVAEPAVPHRSRRPKRNISPKSYDITAGLSWKEERELKKALYASLQESKKASTSKPDEAEDWKTPSDAGFRPIKSKLSTTRMTRSYSSPNVPSTQVTSGQSVNSVDETSQDSTVSLPINTSTLQSKKTKVRAQRKFAMNQPNTITPTSSESSSTPTPKATTSSTIVFPKRAKTEDFLTFLCLRGTSLLPPHLDFFNYSRYDNSSLSGRNGIDSSSTSSSTSISNGTEEPIFTPVNKFTTPCKKAARASAGTPETCRGLAGVKRLDKTPKTKSPLARRGRPARTLNITPVKTPPPKESSPSKVVNNRLGKRGLGKDRLASKRKAVATLTHKAPPVKLKKAESTEEQNKSNKVTKALGVACSDNVICSLHGRMVDCTCLVPCQNMYSPAYSTNIDASLTNLCTFPDLFPLIPPDFYDLSENDLPPELYSDSQEEHINKGSAEVIQTSDGNMLQTVQPDATEDVKMSTDDILDSDADQQNSKEEKATIIQIRLSDNDVLFATSAIRVCKVEAEEQQTDSGTNPQPSSKTEEGEAEMPTLKEEPGLSDEEYQSFLSSNGWTHFQEMPELVLKEEPDFLDLEPGGLSVFPEPYLQPENTSDFASNSPESAYSNLVEQEGQTCTSSQNTVLSNQEQFYPEADAASEKEPPKTVLDSPLQTAAHSFCEEVQRVPDHEVIHSVKSCDVSESTTLRNVTDVTEDFRMEDTGLSQEGNAGNIPDNRKITSPSFADDLFYESQEKPRNSTELMSNTEACIVDANKTQDLECRHTAANLEYTRKSEKNTAYGQDKDVPLDLSLPKVQKHESEKNIEIGSSNLSLIYPNSEKLIHVPSSLSQGVTTIKIEKDKIIIHHRSKGERTEMSSNKENVKHLGIGLKVQNRCDNGRQVNVVLPYSLVKADGSPKIAASVNNSLNVATEGVKSPESLACREDKIVPLNLHKESNEESFVVEETGSNQPKLHAINCFSLKQSLMMKTDAIKLGSNVFQRPPHVPGIVWKSNKKPVIDFTKTIDQPFSDFPQSISQSLCDSPSMENLSNDIQSNLAPRITHSARHVSFVIEKKHCSGSQSHNAPHATHSPFQLSHDQITSTTSDLKRHLLPLMQQSARQISQNSRDKLPNITQTQLMPDLLKNLGDCQEMSWNEAKDSDTAGAAVPTDGSPQKTMVTPDLSPPLLPTIPWESFPSETETDNVRFKGRRDFLKEFRIHPSEIDENHNTVPAQSRVSPWFEQREQHELLEDSNNNYWYVDKGKHGETKDTEQFKSNTPSQFLDSMKSHQILDSHILQKNKNEYSFTYKSKSVDENRNILIMDRNMQEGNNCSVPNIKRRQRKRLFPLPPAIMSSWYY